MFEQVENQLDALPGLHIDLHAEFLRIDCAKARRLVDIGDAERACHVERTLALDADHFGTEEREQLAGVRTGPDLGQFQYPHALQRATAWRDRKSTRLNSSH